ncbi:WD40 repeat domain-containing protein [Ferruginibacter sp. SUN106]|uniref:WD40 repeat domain-containing protein n=1 Tax=Ferruginibacter sp. SUN106 TaxID=2978348 RepID=UPI003D367ACE
MTEQRYEKIRAISATVNGDRFAVSEWNSNVQIWDIKSGLVSKFTTDIVSGMTNAISIAEDGKQIAIAGYDHKTVTLYDVDSGDIIWQRKDIKKPATAIILNYYPNLIYINTENQGAFLLDRKTGATVEKLRGIEFIRENPYSATDLFEKSSTSTLANRGDRKIIKRFTHKSFALLDACFSKDKIICAYSTNPTEAISLSNFETLWTINVTGHFLDIEYSNELDKILGIRWEYEKGSPKYLCYINIKTGNVEKEINLGEPIEIKFLKQGSLMLTSEGKLYSTITGQEIKQFDFESE